MNILYLGPENKLVDFLDIRGEVVTVVQDKINCDMAKGFNFLISYGYRRIIKKDVLDLFVPNRRINLHISMLPWNRGSDPNYWSWKDKTPKGVTIHQLDEGVDTGKILLQREVDMHPDETLISSYIRLKQAIENLFMCNWERLRDERCIVKEQVGEGSMHKLKDFPYDREKMNWNMKVRDI